MRKKTKTFFYAGIDDATRCPCIGSIFISGVIADSRVIEYWKNLGVKDSKLVTPKRREILAELIKNTSRKFVIKEITPELIDDKSFNLNEWEMIIVLRVLSGLMYDQDISLVYIDNWEVSNKKFIERLDFFSRSDVKSRLKSRGIDLELNKFRNILFKPGHRADEIYTIVGAASILSKTSSDKQYREYRKIYGDFGSGSPGDPKTRKFVWDNRKSTRDSVPIIRRSWLTYKVIRNLKDIRDDTKYRR